MKLVALLSLFVAITVGVPLAGDIVGIGPLTPQPIAGRPAEPRPVEPRSVEPRPLEPRPAEPRPPCPSLPPMVFTASNRIKKWKEAGSLWCVLLIGHVRTRTEMPSAQTYHELKCKNSRSI